MNTPRGPISPHEAGKRRTEDREARTRSSDAVALEAIIGERATLVRENKALQEFVAWQAERIVALEHALAGAAELVAA